MDLPIVRNSLISGLTTSGFGLFWALERPFSAACLGGHLLRNARSILPHKREDFVIPFQPTKGVQMEISIISLSAQRGPPRARRGP
jgi:hypothetical protein